MSNLPCPFCGGDVDPNGWLNSNGERGPECETCGATAPSLQRWNIRLPASAPEPPADHSTCPFCDQPCDDTGSIWHRPHCEGLQNAGITKLRLHYLTKRAAQPPGCELPEELFDGHAVWLEAGNVQSRDVTRVLDAIVKLIRKRQSRPTKSSEHG